MGRKNAGAVTAIDVKIAVNRTLFRRPFSLLLHFVRFLVGAQLLGRVPCLQLHTAQLPLVFRLHNQLPQFSQLYTVVRSYFVVVSQDLIVASFYFECSTASITSSRTNKDDIVFFFFLACSTTAAGGISSCCCRCCLLYCCTAFLVFVLYVSVIAASTCLHISGGITCPYVSIVALRRWAVETALNARTVSGRSSIQYRTTLIWFGFCLVWFGLVWFGLVWFGLVWFGSVWFGLCLVVWFGLVWLGFIWRGFGLPSRGGTFEF